MSTEESSPVGFWAEKLGVKLNYRPTPPEGKKYCDCDNPRHAGCSIQIKLGEAYCEWCALGCNTRRNQFSNPVEMV